MGNGSSADIASNTATDSDDDAAGPPPSSQHSTSAAPKSVFTERIYDMIASPALDTSLASRVRRRTLTNGKMSASTAEAKSKAMREILLRSLKAVIMGVGLDYDTSHAKDKDVELEAERLAATVMEPIFALLAEPELVGFFQASVSSTSSLLSPPLLLRRLRSLLKTSSLFQMEHVLKGKKNPTPRALTIESGTTVSS